MTHDIVLFLTGITCIVAAAYWSAAVSTMTNTLIRVIGRLIAVAFMIAGAVQLSLAVNAYV